MLSMTRHRSHSVDFKRQVVQEYLAGQPLQGLAVRHDLSRNLIRIWIEKYEAGAFDEETVAVDLLQRYEARIASLERLVGKQAMELELLQTAMKSAARMKGISTSAVVEPDHAAGRKGFD
jgi:transposase-like protein